MSIGLGNSGSQGGGGGASTFDGIGSGTNTSASMVVGAGASIATTSTGTNQATTLKQGTLTNSTTGAANWIKLGSATTDRGLVMENDTSNYNQTFIQCNRSSGGGAQNLWTLYVDGSNLANMNFGALGGILYMFGSQYYMRAGNGQTGLLINTNDVIRFSSANPLNSNGGRVMMLRADGTAHYLLMSQQAQIVWNNTADYNSSIDPDVGMVRAGVANVVKITNGSTGGGALRLLNMTAPSAVTGGGHIYAKATGNGELYTLDGDGNETLISPHGVQQWLDAGGTLLPAELDPMPQISVERNVFIGKEVLIYRLKKDLDPNSTDWRIVRDLPPEECRDWDAEQERQAVEKIDAFISNRNAELEPFGESLSAKDLSADDIMSLHNFTPKPAWMDRAEATEQGYVSRMVEWVKGWFK